MKENICFREECSKENVLIAEKYSVENSKYTMKKFYQGLTSISKKEMRESMYKVNVLFSTYNGEKYLKELINSVLKQGQVDVRLLIRDDGSTDNTIRISEEYNEPRIELFI